MEILIHVARILWFVLDASLALLWHVVHGHIGLLLLIWGFSVFTIALIWCVGGLEGYPSPFRRNHRMDRALNDAIGRNGARRDR